MKTLILALLVLCSGLAHAQISVEYNTGVAEQITQGNAPNDVLTSSISPNVGITTYSDLPGIYSVVGVDITCQGNFAVQKEQDKLGANLKKLTLNLSTINVIGYDQWTANETNCVMVWHAESIGSKLTTGTSISFSVGGNGAGISISTSTGLDEPASQAGRTSTTEFKMYKEQSTSGSSGSSC